MDKKLLKKFVLSDYGIQYIIYSLQRGHELSNFMLENIDFNLGEVYTYVPVDTEEAQIYNFGGGIYKANPAEKKVLYLMPDGQQGAIYKKGQIVNAEYWLIENIFNHFKTDLSNMGIFEDPIRGESTLSYQQLDYARAYKNVLYSLITKNMSKEKVFEIITEIPNFKPPLIGFLSHSNNLFLTKDKHLNEESLNDVVKTVQKVIVGAYDSEGYIIWDKGKR